MGARVIRQRPETGIRVQTGLPQEEPGHYVARGRAFTAEGHCQIARQARQLFQGVGRHSTADDELGVEFGVALALGHRLGAGVAQPGLHTGESAEESQVQVSLLESGHHRRVVGAGNVFHRHPQLLGEVFREPVVPPGKPGGVLVGNAADSEHRNIAAAAGSDKRKKPGEGQAHQRYPHQESIPSFHFQPAYQMNLGRYTGQTAHHEAQGYRSDWMTN